MDMLSLAAIPIFAGFCNRRRRGPKRRCWRTPGGLTSRIANGDGCKAGTLFGDRARLNWSPDVTNCNGTLTVFEVVSFKPCTSNTWTAIYTNSAHSISGCSSENQRSFDVSMARVALAEITRSRFIARAAPARMRFARERLIRIVSTPGAASVRGFLPERLLCHVRYAERGLWIRIRRQYVCNEGARRTQSCGERRGNRCGIAGRRRLTSR